MLLCLCAAKLLITHKHVHSHACCILCNCEQSQTYDYMQFLYAPFGQMIARFAQHYTATYRPAPAKPDCIVRKCTEGFPQCILLQCHCRCRSHKKTAKIGDLVTWASCKPNEFVQFSEKRAIACACTYDEHNMQQAVLMHTIGLVCEGKGPQAH